MTIGNKRFNVHGLAHPSQLLWKTLGAAVVIEDKKSFLRSGGGQYPFDSRCQTGSSALAKDSTTHTVVLSIDDAILKTKLLTVSTIEASCTINYLAPVVKVLDDHLGIEQGVIITIHTYTAYPCLQEAPCAF